MERANDASDADLAVVRQQIALRAANLAWTPDLSARVSGRGGLGTRSPSSSGPT
ncbi:MAG: hypothetical protein R3F59_00585 [Myxococcota bacterium]